MVINILKVLKERQGYLEETAIIDFKHPSIQRLADQLKHESSDDIDIIRRSFHYVRDEIGHSADIKGKVVTCKASEVLEHRQGICYAKSHLLAALLRANHIPCGLCYQRLLLDDEKAPYMILHGLNGVYVTKEDRWIRLDARGNKTGVQSMFNLEKEQLAFPVRKDKGEEDILCVFPQPDKHVIGKLRHHKNVAGLMADLPKVLEKNRL